MKRCRCLIVPMLLAAFAGPAPALTIGIFTKHTKPNPRDRVPELLGIVKTDKDEHKRAQAAEELREYDVAAFPDIIPILCDVLLHDEKPSVRSEAAASLGKIRPISQEAGWTLEQAMSKDSSMRVRLQARSALIQYHVAGYHSAKTDDGKNPPQQSKEPPVAGPPLSQNPGIGKPGPTLPPLSVPPLPHVEPANSFPLPPVPSSPTPDTGSPQRLPAGPSQPPQLEQTPPAASRGPELSPPNF